MLKSMAKASPQGVEMSNGDELGKFVLSLPQSPIYSSFERLTDDHHSKGYVFSKPRLPAYLRVEGTDPESPTALSAVKLSKEHSLETFPTEVRLQIYRELLLVDDEEYEEIELDELEGLDLHPAILRGNRKIHDEAASVLYGENTFKHTLAGFQHIKLWHSYGCEGKTTLSRRYSRLITKVFLYLDLAGDDNDPSMHAVLDAAATLRSNIDGAARKLALNDLRLLKIRFRNAYTGGPLNYFRGDWYRFGGNPFWGQDCLEPLLKTRATRVSYHSGDMVPF